MGGVYIKHLLSPKHNYLRTMSVLGRDIQTKTSPSRRNAKGGFVYSTSPETKERRHEPQWPSLHSKCKLDPIPSSINESSIVALFS